MAAKQPKSKPQATTHDVLAIVEAHKINRTKDQLCLVGIRGYYLDSMGQVGKNDRGMYDDAVFVVTPNEVRAFNFNMDASAYRKGKGKGTEKGMAMLKMGVWRYKPGMHKTYMAFVQAAKVTVVRDGTAGNYEDTGYFGINLHRGGINGTSSLGCNTWPTLQFDEAKKYIYAKLKDLGQKDFPYIVIEEIERRKGNLHAA